MVEPKHNDLKSPEGPEQQQLLLRSDSSESLQLTQIPPNTVSTSSLEAQDQLMMPPIAVFAGYD